jgi:threonine dehydrogenase-like Zn-dependent dehydrogenase
VAVPILFQTRGAYRGVRGTDLMRQLTYVGDQRLEWHDVPEPSLEGGDDALVRPIAVATCDLDTGIVQGSAPLPAPFAFGHEFVADIVAIGDSVTSVQPGDRVVVAFQISCGRCERCRRGLTANCATVPVLSSFGLAPLSREWGGALSDLVRVPYADAMTVPVPRGIDPATIASVGDNVPDGWRSVAAPLREHPGSPVLVIGGAGAGSVGLYAVAAAIALGSERVDYADTDPQRLRVAEELGASVTDGPVKRRYGPYPITVNHAATPDGLAAALRSTEPGGICTSTSIYFDADTPIPLLEMYGTGVTLTTGRVNARALIPEVLNAVAAGRLRPERVTSAVVPWEHAPEVLAKHTHKTVITRDSAAR